MHILRNMVVLDAERTRAECADVTVEKGRIVSVLPAGSATGEITFDGKGRMALLPGLVNAHGHAAMVLVRGLGEETELMTWLQTQIWPVESRLVGEHVYWGTKQAMLEMIAGGCTTFADMYFFMDEAARAVFDGGMRCGLCRGVIYDGNDASFETRMAEQVALFDQWHGKEGRMTVQYGPHAPYTVPGDRLREVVAAAKAKGAGLQVHWLESKWEADYFANELKKDPIDYLGEMGILDASFATLAHGVWFPADRVGEIARDNLTVVHNPSSNLKLGSGVAPIPEMLCAGVKVALGTDGAASNNRLDVWQEMRTTALLHKGIRHDPTTVSAASVLRMATVDGARSLGFHDVGLIKEGWQADFALVDLDLPHYVGWTPENLMMYLVYAGSAADVRGTMVQGKWLYCNGEYAGIDARNVLEKSALCRKALMSA